MPTQIFKIKMKELLRLLLVLTLGLLILSAYKMVDDRPVIKDDQKNIINLVFKGTAKILKGIVEQPIDYDDPSNIYCGVIALPDDISETNIIEYAAGLTEVIENTVAQTEPWRRTKIDNIPVIIADYTIYNVPLQLLYIKTKDRNDLIFIVPNN